MFSVNFWAFNTHCFLAFFYCLEQKKVIILTKSIKFLFFSGVSCENSIRKLELHVFLSFVVDCNFVLCFLLSPAEALSACDKFVTQNDLLFVQ